MINLVSSIGTISYKRGIVKVIFVFSLFPVVLYLVNQINPDFLTMNGSSVDYFTFLNLLMKLMNSLFIPIGLLIQLASYLYFEEYKGGQIGFYKDINKKRLYLSKEVVVFMTYFIYLFGLILSITLMYFLMSKGEYNIVYSLFSSNPEYDIVYFITVILSQILMLQIGITISLRFNSVYSILGVFLYFLIGSLSPMLGFMKYLFLNSYVTTEEPITGLINVIALFAFYTAIMQKVNIKKMETKES